MTAKVDEQHATLWTLAIPPLVWAAHFLLSYCTAAVWCAKYAGSDRSLDLARLSIALYTALALGGLALAGWAGYRKHHLDARREPHHADSPEGRYRFLGYATMLLSGLSAIAVLYAALVIVFIRSCH